MRKNFKFEIVRGAASILLALSVAMIFIFVISETPFDALYNLIVGPFTKVRYFYIILERMIPIIFTGLAVCVMFNANQFNLAAEGTLFFGALIASVVAIYLQLPPVLHTIVCIAVAMLVGGLAMLIPAVLKTKLGASEMVSSLMLNYILLQLGVYLLNYYYADRTQGATMSYPFQPTAKIAKLIPKTNLSWGIVIALVATVLVSLFLYRTKWGYAIRIVGLNKSFAKYSGIKVGATVIMCQVIGGLLAGMGGAVEVLGYYNRFEWKQLPGYGWDGVTIAILAKNNPIFVPVAAFFMAYLRRGCDLMQLNTDVPAEMLSIIQAVIFLFFAAEQFLSKYRHKLVVKDAKDEIAERAVETTQKGVEA
ncbi:MAG: ABC transporter permease [Angelakisella sp.]